MKQPSAVSRQPSALSPTLALEQRTQSSVLKPLLARLLLCAALSSLGACTFLYVPPVPEPVAQPVSGDLRPLLSASAGLRRTSDGLELRLNLSRVPREGWLELQWFSPANRQIASDALWIRPQDEGSQPVLNLPEGTVLRPGVWRVVASFDGALLRQFSLEVTEP